MSLAAAATSPMLSNESAAPPVVTPTHLPSASRPPAQPASNHRIAAWTCQRICGKARARTHRSVRTVPCSVLFSEIVPFGASLTSSQLHWIRDHDGRGKLSSGNPGQVKVVEEDLGEETDGDGGEEEGAKVDEGQTVEEGASEQIPT